MSKHRRHPLAAAEAVAHELRGLLAPFCARIEVAGSIRRRRSTVGDIELLAIPRMDAQRDMFGGEAGETDQLDQSVRELMADGVLTRRRLPGNAAVQNDARAHNFNRVRMLASDPTLYLATEATPFAARDRGS